jgi:hypothetical protein
MINGNNNHQHQRQQMEKSFLEKQLTSRNAFNDLLEKADINKENIDVFLRDLQQQQQQQQQQDRRSSFHALRGKRRAE